MEDYSEKRIVTEKSLPKEVEPANREAFEAASEEEVEREWASLWVGGGAEFMVQMQAGQAQAAQAQAPVAEVVAETSTTLSEVSGAVLPEMMANLPDSSSEIILETGVPQIEMASLTAEGSPTITPFPAPIAPANAGGAQEAQAVDASRITAMSTTGASTETAAQPILAKAVTVPVPKPATEGDTGEKKGGASAELLEGMTPVTPQPLMGAMANSANASDTSSDQKQENFTSDRHEGRAFGISQERLQAWFEQKPGSEVARLVRNEQASELMKHALDAAQQAALPKRLTMELASPTGAAVTLVLTSRKGEIHAQLETANPQALQWVNEQMKTFRSLDAGQTVRWLPAQMVEVARRDASAAGDHRGDTKGGPGGRSSDRSESGSKLETGDRAVRGRGERNNKESREKKS
jgi:hypothetical protein